MDLTDAFLSYNSNVWCEPVRKESCGAIASSVIARCYHFVDGYCPFLSYKNRAKIPYADLVTKEGEKAYLNFVINLERFIEDHSGVRIGIRLNKSHNKSTINTSYVGHQCVDGSSNA